jgi:hypothetical protein
MFAHSAVKSSEINVSWMFIDSFRNQSQIQEAGGDEFRTQVSAPIPDFGRLLRHSFNLDAYTLATLMA